jgi:hypothetical protein
MATSTNYGWSEPDNTSLVKNGAEAMRTLGNAIDTSLWNSGYGQAGKNKIINGDFGVWQRGTTFTNPNAVYLADRWVCNVDVAVPTWTISQQTFTPGTAPVAGYESQYFLRAAVTSIGTSTAQYISQRIEDVRTYANQTVTVSFWAKFDTSRTLSLLYQQNFGSGGSGTVTGTISSSVSVTNAWARYSVTFAVPSVSGKTIGTSSSLIILFKTPAANYTFDLWGVQLEYGSTATPFQTASGNNIQGELAMCQRYFQLWTGGQFSRAGFVYADTTTNAVFVDKLPVCLRSTPSLAVSNMTANGNAITAASLPNFSNTNNTIWLNLTTSGVVANTVYQIYTASGTTGVISYSAEL